jgi:hypothetical protein
MRRVSTVRFALPFPLSSPFFPLSLSPLLPCYLFAPIADSSTPDIRTWFSNVEQHASEGVNKILIGNKCDWEEKRAVSTAQGQALADELGIPFIEVSAKSNINVEKAFFSLASDIKKRIIDSSGGSGAGGAQQGAQQVDVGAGGAGVGGMGKNCC